MTTHDRAAPRRANNTLLPTLLDRLKDDTPFRQADAAQDHTLTRAQMRDIIQRDLAYLLNTTNHAGEIDRATHPAAASSVVNFGVPAMNNASAPELLRLTTCESTVGSVTS